MLNPGIYSLGDQVITTAVTGLVLTPVVDLEGLTAITLQVRFERDPSVGQRAQVLITRRREQQHEGREVVHARKVEAAVTGPPGQQRLEVVQFLLHGPSVGGSGQPAFLPHRHVWRGQGFLAATPGNATDFAFIEREIVDLAARFDLREVAYDRTFAGEIVQNLQDEGVKLVEFGQGFLSLAATTAELERLCLPCPVAWRPSGAALERLQRRRAPGPRRQHQAGQGTLDRAHRRHFGAGQRDRPSNVAAHRSGAHPA